MVERFLGKKHNQFEGMTDEHVQVSKLSIDDLHQLECERMEQNAWWSESESLLVRIDDEPVLSFYIKLFVIERPDSVFFFNKPYNSDYNSKTPSERMTVPCSEYISKTVKFVKSHYDFGELYMEFIYGNCIKKQDELWEHCYRSGGTVLQCEVQSHVQFRTRRIFPVITKNLFSIGHLRQKMENQETLMIINLEPTFVLYLPSESWPRSLLRAVVFRPSLSLKRAFSL